MNGRRKLGALVVAVVVVLGAGQVAFAQLQWTIGDVAIPPGSESRHALGDVVFDGTTYHLYVTGGAGSTPLDNSWSVFHWTATNPAGPWTEDPDNPVLEPGPAVWESFSIGGLAVLFDGSTFKMWYAATAGSGSLAHGGYATNADGSGDWDKHAGNPLEGLAPGAPGTWDENGPYPSTVLFDGALYHMWYTGGSGDTWAGAWGIGHATSADGLGWTRDPSPVLVASEPWEEDKVYYPEVVVYGGSLHMWYGGLDMSPVTSSVGYAESADGLSWTKWPGNPLLTPQVERDSISVLVEGTTIHGWISDGAYVKKAESSFLLVDGFETGTTIGTWSLTVP
ncbi:MAG: hypothetical protein MUC56_12330 [Thermoanaerobaculales bacterium]|jgi:hypothetical protein|nr:hypothetical protein [Thermoanaerobaculales bacterium]